ncbi:ribonuclease III domain-containing protein [Desulfitobacterium sp. THU1]|uniref:Mini-ribonuclease 3 n=1 Tax=Desulfitobacterium sp. THU1 TaxID=3138072 RepID=UPI00311F7271
MPRSWQEMNALTLAYLGDAVYELWVRTHLLDCGYEKVNDLHRYATKYVRAATQAKLLHQILPDLDEQETSIVHRGRNAKGGHPKSTDVVTYRHATAFEALVGYWQLTDKTERMLWAFEQVDELILEGDGEKSKANILKEDDATSDELVQSHEQNEMDC